MVNSAKAWLVNKGSSPASALQIKSRYRLQENDKIFLISEECISGVSIVTCDLFNSPGEGSRLV